MSDHRYVVRGHAKEGLLDVTELPNAVTSPHQEITDDKPDDRSQHLAPVSMTAGDVMLLPVAHRYSA